MSSFKSAETAKKNKQMAVYFFEYVILMSFANAMDVRMKIKYPEGKKLKRYYSRVHR